MEGRNFNLPPDDQVPHRVRSGRGMRGPSSGARMLHCHVGDVHTSDWEERSSLRKRYVGKRPIGRRPSERPQGNL